MEVRRAVPLVVITLALTAATTALFVDTVGVRLRRDVARLVLEDRLEVLDSAMVREGGKSAWKFDTPRGRLVVQSKEEAPVWAPPD